MAFIISTPNIFPYIFCRGQESVSVACGDFTWMREIDLGDISYIGADIVNELIEKNIRNYSGKNRTFIVADVVKDVLPKADIILCRDCFVHLSNKDIVRALKNF